MGKLTPLTLAPLKAKRNMPEASILVVVDANTPTINKDMVNSVLNQTVDEIELIILDQRNKDWIEKDRTTAFLQKDPRIFHFAKSFKNRAQALNFGLELAKSNYVLNLPLNVELMPNAITSFIEAIRKNPNYAMVYSDYQEVFPDGSIQEKRLYDYEGDITERCDFGKVKLYRLEHVFSVGKYDESYNFAEEYDLRLKLDDKYQFVHLKEILYKYYVPPEEMPDFVATSKLHSKEGGRLGVFSYLFYSKDMELEYERACKSMLRRRGAFLYNDPATVTYPEGTTFPVMVSVIIPVYNRVKYIGKAIESVLAQTFQNFEIIVVDNGSTDGTIELVEEYCKKDKRIRLIKNNKNIIALALNIGLREARGKYYAQLDSDDEYVPQTLEKMVQYLETHPKTALAISYYELIDENSQPMPEFGIIKHLEYDRNNIMRVDGAGALRVYHRKVVLEEFGGFDEVNFGDYGEDYDMNLKISEKYAVGRVHEVLYRYRRHPDNTDAKRDPYMRIHNKTLARQLALKRRIQLNKSSPGSSTGSVF